MKVEVLLELSHCYLVFSEEKNQNRGSESEREREREKEQERMSSRESGNTVSVIQCRPSVIFLNNEAGPVALAAPAPTHQPREVTEAVGSDYKRKVSKLIVSHSRVCNITNICLEIIFSLKTNFYFGNLTSQLCDGGSI